MYQEKTYYSVRMLKGVYSLSSLIGHVGKDLDIAAIEQFATQNNAQKGGERILTYTSPVPLSPGNVVLCPYASVTCVGIVVGKTEEVAPEIAYEDILEVLV